MNAQEIIRSIEEQHLKSDLPTIYVGDTVKVGVRISEGGKERVQPYEGVVIAMRNGGINETITVRRIFQGVGVEARCSPPDTCSGSTSARPSVGRA
ncbi:MAG: 50S ribosomal protein L19, partial [Merismopedia sp. SIO2A8]|nr:50S ribosomal protein L19 [Merismopedia sp. SIO2A8]